MTCTRLSPGSSSGAPLTMKQGALTFTDDPFIEPGNRILANGNSTALPEQNTIVEEDLFRKPIDTDELLKKGKAKQVSHAGRSRNYWEKCGYVYQLCEYRDLRYQGEYTTFGRKHDLFGLFDALAVKLGEPLIGVQVCSTNDANKHFRDMCSDDIDTRSGNRRKIDNLRLWLAMGFRVVVIEWQRRPKVGNKEWFEVLHEVTTETIEGVLARRKKK